MLKDEIKLAVENELKRASIYGVGIVFEMAALKGLKSHEQA